MEEKRLMTKNCIAPWQTLEICVDGRIRPCCGPLYDDFGNIDGALSDPTKFRDTFNSKAYRELRNQLLTGNLQDGCVTCRIAPQRPVTTESLRQSVELYLKSRGRNITENTDLLTEFAFESCNTAVTDKCNLSCIYCFTHSNDKPGEGIKNYTEVSYDRFLKLVSLLVQDGLKLLVICGVGEPTVYRSWKELCTTLFDSFPGLFICLVSNFGKKFTDADLDVLKRFHRILISCDTLDPELHSWLRRGGRIDVLLDNISRLKAKTRNNPGHKQILTFNVTESNAIIDKLVDLAKFAVDNEIGLQFSNLLIVEGSYAEKNNCLTKITEIPDEQVPAAWEVICDITERTSAQNPRFFLSLGPLYEIMKQRAESISFHRFVPSEDELFYRWFASAHPKNPAAFLRKIFRSFSDCYRGILIASGSTLAFNLPHTAARFKYRTIWCKNNHPDKYAGAMEETVVGSHLTIAVERTERFYTHVLLEVFGYEMVNGTARIDETMILSEPRNNLDAHSKALNREAGVKPAGNIPAKGAPVPSKPCPLGDSIAAADFLNAHGEKQSQKGDNHHARVCFELAIEHNPNHAGAHNNLGVVQWQQGNLEQAVRCFHQALDLDPEDPDVIYNCSRALAAAGEFDSAAGLLKLYLQRKPQDPAAWEDYESLIRQSGVQKEFSGDLPPGLHPFTPRWAKNPSSKWITSAQ